MLIRRDYGGKQSLPTHRRLVCLIPIISPRWLPSITFADSLRTFSLVFKSPKLSRQSDKQFCGVAGIASPPLLTIMCAETVIPATGKVNRVRAGHKVVHGKRVQPSEYEGSVRVLWNPNGNSPKIEPRNLRIIVLSTSFAEIRVLWARTLLITPL